MKFWKARPGENCTIRFIEPPQKFDSYFVKLPVEPIVSAEQRSHRFHAPVLIDDQIRTLSFNSQLRDAIVETGRRLAAELQTRLLLDSQREAARRFKVSKLSYGAKR